MTAQAARERLWALAAALNGPMPTEGADAPLSNRARRLARRGSPPLSFADLEAAPAWAVCPDERRARLAALAGGAACAGRWRRTIDGTVLGRAADAIGEAALDALLGLPASMTPAVVDLEAEAGDERALRRLGARALLSEVSRRTALAERLAEQFPDAPLPLADQALGGVLALTACGLLAQVGGAP